MTPERILIVVLILALIFVLATRGNGGGNIGEDGRDASAPSFTARRRGGIT